MIVRSIRVCIPLLLVAWLALACAPANQPPMPATETPGTVMLLTNPQATSTPLETGSESTPAVMLLTNPEVTPMPLESRSEPTPEQAPGQPGQAPGELPTQPDLDTPPSPPPDDLGIWQTYKDNTLRITLSYPSILKIHILNAAELSQLDPAPVAGVEFQDRQNESADSAPPEFSVKQFPNPKQQTLEDWLIGAGLFKPGAEWSSEPYQGKYLSGLKVLRNTFMAPGWYVYVAHNKYVYQLTPLGSAGEQMLASFRFMD